MREVITLNVVPIKVIVYTITNVITTTPTTEDDNNDAKYKQQQ